MGSILVAMPKRENSVQVKDIILRSGIWQEISICRTGAEVLSYVENHEVHLVICMVRFSDMGYEELVTYLPSSVTVVLLTKNAALLPFSPNVVKVMMPFKAEDLITSIRSLLPMELSPRKKKKFRSKEEQEVIDKAKQLLMDKKDMTEPEAFRYIQKTSMDTGRSLVESAQMLLSLNQDAT